MNMVWSVAAVLINYLMNFFITPYITENIGVEAYGFVSLAMMFTSYIDIIAIGLNTYASRFISIAYHRGDRKRANEFFSSVTAGNLALSVALLVPGTVLIARLQEFIRIPESLRTDVKILFAVILVNYFLTLLRTAYNSSAFIANRLDIAERIRSGGYILQAVTALLLCTLLAPRVWYVGIAYAAASLYLLVRYRGVTRRLTPDLRFRRDECSFAAVRELVAAGIWNSLNNMGDVLNSGLDLLITDLLLNATVLGEISIAKNIGMICYSLVKRVSESFQPKQLLLYAEGRRSEQIALYKKTMRFTGAFSSLIIAVFLVCGRDFLSLWIPGQNIPFIYTLCIIVLLSDVSVGVVNPLYYVFTLTKKLRVPCFITLGMGAANVAAMYLLLHRTQMGAYAVVLTTLVLNCVHFIDTPLYAAHCMRVKLTTFYPVILRHIAAFLAGAGTALLLARALPAALTWPALIVKAGAAVLATGAVIGVLMLSGRKA